MVADSNLTNASVTGLEPAHGAAVSPLDHHWGAPPVQPLDCRWIAWEGAAS